MRTARGQAALLIALGIFGAALLYGDGMITPAISVLSAVEGPRGRRRRASSHYVVPITLVDPRRPVRDPAHGTGAVGALFGPVMVVWFATHRRRSGVDRDRAAAGGAARRSIPTYAVAFFVERAGTAFLVLGAVFLAVTGGEALYADMGHFGARPIRLAWFALVLPGAAAELLRPGRAAARRPGGAPTTRSTCSSPDWALYPLVAARDAGDDHRVAGADLRRVLAHAAGGAARLPAAPRRSSTPRRARSARSTCPSVNWALLVACIALVLGFGSSTSLAAAYGIAVTGTMAITRSCFFVVVAAAVAQAARGS